MWFSRATTGHRVQDVESDKTGVILCVVTRGTYYRDLCNNGKQAYADGVFATWRDQFGWTGGPEDPVTVVKFDVPDRPLTFDQYREHVKRRVADPAREPNEMPGPDELTERYQEIATCTYIVTPHSRLKLLGRQPWCCVWASLRRVWWRFNERVRRARCSTRTDAAAAS